MGNHRERRTGQRRFSGRVLAIVLSVAVLLAGLGAGAFIMLRPSGSAAASGMPGAAFANVQLPKGAQPSHYHFSAGPAPAAARASLKGTGMVALTPLREFHSTPRKLPTGTMLRFEVPKGLHAPVKGMQEPVFEAYYNPRTGVWVHERATYNARTGVVLASVTHFSVHAVFTWSADQVKNLFLGALRNVFGSLAAHAVRPQCGATHGVTLSVDQGDTQSVLVCHEASIVTAPTATELGAADITLRLANNRHYPIDVSWPNGSKVHAGSFGSPEAQLGAEITKLSSLAGGKRMTLMPPADLVSIVMPGVPAPFGNPKVRTQIDGAAYLLGIDATAFDVLGKMFGKDPASIVPLLVKEMDAAHTSYRLLTELQSLDLSPDKVKDLGDLGMEALVAIAGDKSMPFGMADFLKLGVAVLDGIWQMVTVEVDTVTGKSFHKYSFGVSGTRWEQPVDLHSVDWANIAIPGGWFHGPATVQLHTDPYGEGAASNVPTSTTGAFHNEAQDVQDLPDQVVYGDLNGDGVDEAAVLVTLEAAGAGTASGQRGNAFLIYKAAPGGPMLVGIITAQSGWPGAWTDKGMWSKTNPKGADHTDLIYKIRFSGDELVVPETYYGPTDYTALPTGKAVSTWRYADNGLTLVSTVITHRASGT